MKEQNEIMVTAEEDDIDLMMSKDELLMNEDALLSGLLEAATFADDEECRKKIEIKRNGKKLYEFTIRPLAEEESNECLKASTKRLHNPMGKKYPKIDGETDYVALRSRKIYTATVPEDRKKLWDNQKVKRALNVMTALDVIDKVLLAGEKSRVVDEIDELSGFNAEVEEEEVIKN
ncbi:phage tail assembly chaperone [Acetobacterium tundrae]|nr:hypothetical protein [Acetobacterium tundrae]